jgi:hypothetical protein
MRTSRDLCWGAFERVFFPTATSKKGNFCEAIKFRLRRPAPKNRVKELFEKGKSERLHVFTSKMVRLAKEDLLNKVSIAKIKIN